MRIVVVGTGTEIGKTHVTECLLAHARTLGVRARAYKPVATGVEERCDDCERHAAASASEYLPPTYAYRRPVSPHLAAREEGRPIDLSRIAARVSELESTVDVLLVESAGGLFSPLGEQLTNLELVQRVSPARVLLVAADRLGVLHDVRATTEAARARGVKIDGVVLSEPSAPDSSTGSNAGELAQLGIARVLAAFPRSTFDSAISKESARSAWSAITAA